MRFSVVALVSSLAVVSAQKTINVIVGGNGTLTYSPANFTADIGDTVTFEFQSKNHTVSQSLFASPCDQFVNTTVANAQPLTSGFRPVPANATSFPTWSIQITQTTPIWFFCAQTGHCNKGMVGAINAVETGPNNFAAFQAKATATSTATNTTASGTASPSGSAASGSPTASGTNAAGRVAALPTAAITTVLLSMVGVAFGMTL